MKTIGLIGGMSWDSTLYYRLINEETKRRLGGQVTFTRFSGNGFG